MCFTAFDSLLLYRKAIQSFTFKSRFLALEIFLGFMLKRDLVVHVKLDDWRFHIDIRPAL